MANDDEDAMPGSTLLSKVLVIYGPYAFSLVSILILWYGMVNPILDRQQINWQKVDLLTDKVREIATTQLESARAIERSALILDATLKRIADNSK